MEGMFQCGRNRYTKNISVARRLRAAQEGWIWSGNLLLLTKHVTLGTGSFSVPASLLLYEWRSPMASSLWVERRSSMQILSPGLRTLCEQQAASERAHGSD